MIKIYLRTLMIFTLFAGGFTGCDSGSSSTSDSKSITDVNPSPDTDLTPSTTAPNLLWSVALGGPNNSGGPAIDNNGTIYIGSTEGIIKAINSDGSVKWTQTYLTTHPAEVYINGVPQSLVNAVPDGFDLDTMPDSIWFPLETDETGQNFSSASPALSPDQTQLYLGGPESGLLYAFNTSDGSIDWSFNVHDLTAVQNDTYLYGGGFAGSPVVAVDGTIYFGSGDHWGDQWLEAQNMGVDIKAVTKRRFSDRRLYALNPDGTLKWVFELEETDSNRPGIFGSPALASNGLIYVSSFNGIMYALRDDGTKATEVYRYENINETLYADTVNGPKYIEWWPSPALASDGTIYMGSNDNYMYAFNPDLTVKWKYKSSNEIFASAIVGANDEVYFTGEDQNLYAVSAEGKELWVYRDYQGTETVPFVPILTEDGTLILAADNSDHIVGINAKTGDLLWKSATLHNVEGGFLVNIPTLATDGTIYVCIGDKIYALEGSSPLHSVAPWPKYQKDLTNTGRQ